MEVNIEKLDFQSDRILSSLKEHHRQRFVEAASTLNFKAGKLIFYEGGVPTGVFLIKSGRAKIFKTGLDGKDQIFYIYKPWDLLGYHALLCDEFYEDACEAIEPCEVLFIKRQIFEELLSTIPNLQLLLIQNMSHEFGVMVNTITMLAQKPLRERLAIYLLVLQNRYRDDKNPEGLIKLSRIDLANLIGTARESLSRLLKEFREEGLMEVKVDGLRLKDTSRLSRIANSQYI